jgi:hypothetical protein
MFAPCEYPDILGEEVEKRNIHGKDIRDGGGGGGGGREG